MSRQRAWRSSTISRVIAAAMLAGLCLVYGFDARTESGAAGDPKEVIVARKTLMNSIMSKMDKIGNMISERKFDLSAAKESADDISVMLMAFPHLFPPESNQWKEGETSDPATDTIASPDIWISRADFDRRAELAAATAFEMSRAEDEDQIKHLHRALGIACDICHSLYLKE